MSAEEERLWSILRANSLDFNAWTALIEETEKVAEGNWTWEHAKLKARMQTLQRNLRYPPMASNFRYIQGMHLSLLINKKCDEDDYILTYQDKEGE
ncbi:hypothetical protein ES332_A13G122100v1 [Gossypium tomentosum]|uniref:Uncharacterized protein n=1 Tax=Gossypium tomentosum TaxID=34277 RepID=A0A5D2MJ54_GOSTO|nr:hypothetical protein ES332_A13G122100v1 [Gossypium tomentosum]